MRLMGVMIGGMLNEYGGFFSPVNVIFYKCDVDCIVRHFHYPCVINPQLSCYGCNDVMFSEPDNGTLQYFHP